jgi:hypothetical protein
MQYSDFHRLDRTSLRLAQLFDYLVREREQLVWHGQSERFGSIEIYDQHIFCGELDREIGRLLALKNAVDVACRYAAASFIIRLGVLVALIALCRSLPNGWG